MKGTIHISETSINAEAFEASSVVFDHIEYLFSGIEESDVIEINEQYQTGTLPAYLSRVDFDLFALVIINHHAGTVEVYNDHFGSNDFLLKQENGNCIITTDARALFAPDQKPNINKHAFFECVVFQSIQPPETIYVGVQSIQSGHRVVCSYKAIEHIRYWDIEEEFSPKQNNYEQIVHDAQQALYRKTKQLVSPRTGVGLSGGIDSGGLLGMATKALGQSINSYTIGGHGSATVDLTTSRESSEFNDSPNIEMYPQFSDLSRLVEYTEGLNQPISADTVLPYSMIYEEAANKGDDSVMFGMGAEMLLGNLKISKIAYVLSKIEMIIPHVILGVVYRIISWVAGFSQTQREFLLSFSWTDRFIYTRGALYTWEKDFLIGDHNSFWSYLQNKTEQTTSFFKGDLIDKMVVYYLFSWVNYLQYKDFIALGHRHNIKPVLPFDSLAVARVLMKVPTKFRKIQGWNKQIIRELFRPYVSPRLYTNQVRSLIVPYSTLLDGREESIFQYLDSHEVIGDFVELEKLKESYASLPEPGLFVWRLLGFAVWYDVNWNHKHLVHYTNLFKK